jgi:hypothetical protein
MEISKAHTTILCLFHGTGLPDAASISKVRVGGHDTGRLARGVKSPYAQCRSARRYSGDCKNSCWQCGRLVQL